MSKKQEKGTTRQDKVRQWVVALAPYAAAIAAAYAAARK